MEQSMIDDILMDLYTRRKSYKQQIVWDQEKMKRKLKQIERKKKLENISKSEKL